MSEPIKQDRRGASPGHGERATVGNSAVPVGRRAQPFGPGLRPVGPMFAALLPKLAEKVAP